MEMTKGPAWRGPLHKSGRWETEDPTTQGARLTDEAGVWSRTQTLQPDTSRIGVGLEKRRVKVKPLTANSFPKDLTAPSVQPPQGPLRFSALTRPGVRCGGLPWGVSPSVGSCPTVRRKPFTVNRQTPLGGDTPSPGANAPRGGSGGASRIISRRGTGSVGGVGGGGGGGTWLGDQRSQRPIQRKACR